MNVRWDAVVKSDALRAARPLARSSLREPSADAPVHARLPVRIWLFGRLAGQAQRNPIELELGAGCRLRDVFDALEARFGPGFLRRLVGDSGTPFDTCRVALNGTLATDPSTPVTGAPRCATIEIILFREIEGG